jgi:hypothetical protein
MPIGEELSKSMRIFAQLGFPGAVGSLNVTHIRWDKQQMLCLRK